jgi:hypothetical protein
MSVVIPTDSPSIFAALNTLSTQTALLAIVRPNNPPPGIAGFLLDLPEDDSAELESDITDHYLEDNTAVQDQIALRPETITLTGKVAELVKTVPTSANVAAVTNPLPLVSGLQPTFSPGAAQTMAQSSSTSAAANAAVADTQTLYGYYNAHVPQQPNQTKQSLVFGYIYQLWLGRQLFTVETPWGTMTNMAILSAAAKQDGVSRSVTDFSITFKKIRTAQRIFLTAGQLAGRSVFQQAPVSNNGTIGQNPVTTAQQGQFLQQATPFGIP